MNLLVNKNCILFFVTVWRDTLKNRRTYQRLGEDFTVLSVTSWECRSIADCAKHIFPGWTMKIEAESD